MAFEINTVLDALRFIGAAVPRTLLIAAFTLVLGIIFGAVIAVIRLGCGRLVNGFLAVIISFVRAVPLIVQVFIMYYSLPYVIAPVLGHFSGRVIPAYEVSPYWTACVLFIIYHTAFQTEVIRGALLSVDKGQYEAAVSVGLTPWQAYRRIIFPQALAAALPNFFTAYVHAVKFMSLTFTIKLVDIFAAADIYAATYSRRTEPYIADALVYWALCVGLTVIFNHWERSLRQRLAH